MRAGSLALPEVRDQGGRDNALTVTEGTVTDRRGVDANHLTKSKMSTFAPRVQLPVGVELPLDFQLPSIQSVTEDIALREFEIFTTTLSSFKHSYLVQHLKSNGPPTNIDAIFTSVSGASQPIRLTEPLFYYTQLQNLFKWTFFVRVQDSASPF